MKEEKKPGAWKNELLNGLGELILTFAAIGIGLGIAFLFPHEVIKDIPFEVFWVIGSIILVAVIGIVVLIVHLVKRNKK